MQKIKQKMRAFGKAVRHFWRGLTPRMRTVGVLGLAVLCAAGALCAVLLQKNTGTDPARTAELLFPATSRAQIQKITMHPKGKEEYAIARLTDKDDGTASFVLTRADVQYTWLTLGAETLSSLVVSAGQNRIYEAVISAPASAADYATEAEYEEAKRTYERRLVTYGLAEGDNYYTLEDVSGNTYTVYYGKKDVTGEGYYLRLEGRDTVYVSNSADMGDFLNGDCEQFLSGMSLLMPSNTTLAYNYPRRFETTRRLSAGEKVEGNDAVTLLYRDENGEERTVVADLARYPRIFHDTLVGKKVGSYRDAPIVFEASFSSSFYEEEYAGRTVRFEVLSLEADRLWFGLRFMQASERSLLHKFSIYEFYAPSSITACDPDGNAVPTILEDLYGLTGTVVKIGLDGETMQKYGLYKNRILFEYPVIDEEEPYKKDADGNATEDINPTAYLSAYLYVSAPDKDGKRYVASTMYGVVAQVEADIFSFLEEDFSGLVEGFTVNAGIVDISRIEISWRFGTSALLDGSRTVFDIRTELYKANENATAQERIAEVKAALTDKNGKKSTHAVATRKYTDFFYILYYIQYGGTNGLSEEEIAALRESDTADCLSMTLYFKDGDSILYRFVPLSANRTAVFITNGKTGRQNDRFYVYATDVKELAAAFCAMFDN